MDKQLSIPHSFTKGLNTDTSPLLFSNEQYSYLKNFRVITDSDSDNGALTSVNGNTLKFKLPEQEYYLGSGYIREKLVIFSVSEDINGAVSNIYTFLDDYSSNVINLTKIYSDLSITDITKRLNFNKNHQIKVIGRYETADVQKVYWVDGINSLRSCNVMVDLSQYTASNFNIIPGFTYSSPQFSQYVTGNLNAGVYSYAYQLYSLNGNETTYTPCSTMIPTFNGQAAYTLDLLGESKETNSGKGIICTISNLPDNYDRIRVVAIQYEDINISPIIRIIEESNYTGSEFTFIDVGNSIGSYSIADYLVIGKLNLIPNTIETKDNLLFVGNVTIPNFDIDYDARAYRFPLNSTTTTVINNGITNNLYYNSSDTIKYYLTENQSVSDNYDVINADIINNKYQANSSILGGSGPNVSYTFSLDSFNITGTNLNIPLTNNNIQQILGIKRSFQRDEVYRLGLVLYNELGQFSFTKWIEDIKTPKIDSTYKTFDGTNAINLYINIVCNNLPSECKYVQAVFVKRQYNDRSVVTQGYCDTWYDNGTNLVPQQILVENSTAQNLLSMHSPEINFNTDLTITNNYYIEKLYEVKLSGSGSFITDSIIIASANSLIPYYGGTTTSSIIKNSQFYKFVNNTNAQTIDQSLIGTTKDALTKSASNPALLATTHWLINPTTNVYSRDNTDGLGIYNIRNNNIISQYGGQLYINRSINTYYQCSDIYSVSSNSAIIIADQGDTFISWFEHLRSCDPLPNNSIFSEIVQIPLESSINLNLRTDKSYSKLITDPNVYLLNEYAGRYGEAFTQLIDMYSYNSVYSRYNDTVIYPSKPFDFVSEAIYDTRVYSSNKKINGESSDSWLQFNSSKMIEVDSSYGSLTRILNHNNIILFFQPYGMGTLSVNSRTVYKDNSALALTLATGGILDRYDYLSTNYGVSEYNAITHSDSSVYFYDSYSNRIIQFKQNEIEISSVTGVNSVLKNIDYNIRILSVYHQEFKDVIFTFHINTPDYYYYKNGNTCSSFLLQVNNIVRTEIYTNGIKITQDYKNIFGGGIILNSNTNFNDNTKFQAVTSQIMTIIFNEHTNSFLGFMDFIPLNYIDHQKYLYSTEDNNSFYIHEKLESSEFYDKKSSDCIIEFIDNYKDNTAISDIIEFYSKEIQSDQIIQQDSSISHLTCSNTKQYNDLDINPIKRFGIWRFHTPRHIGTSQRFRDTYFKCRMLYNGGKKFILNNITSKFRISNF